MKLLQITGEILPRALVNVSEVLVVRPTEVELEAEAGAALGAVGEAGEVDRLTPGTPR